MYCMGQLGDIEDARWEKCYLVVKMKLRVDTMAIFGSLFQPWDSSASAFFKCHDNHPCYVLRYLPHSERKFSCSTLLGKDVKQRASTVHHGYLSCSLYVSRFLNTNFLANKCYRGILISEHLLHTMNTATVIATLTVSERKNP